MHERMRDFQVGLIDGQIVVKQDIDVDRTIVILTIYGFFGRAKRFASPIYDFFAAEIALDLLGGTQELARGKLRSAEDDPIEETVV